MRNFFIFLLFVLHIFLFIFLIVCSNESPNISMILSFLSTDHGLGKEFLFIDAYRLLLFSISQKRKQSLCRLSTSTRKAVYTGMKRGFWCPHAPLVGRWVLPATPAKDSVHVSLSVGPREILTKLHSGACVKALITTLPGVPGCRGDLGSNTRKLCGQKGMEFHYRAQQLIETAKTCTNSHRF